MRSFKSSLVTFSIAGFVGMAAVIGCTAEGASDVIEDQAGTEPTDENGNQLPASNPGASSGGSSGTTSKDAGKDAAKTDAGKDAGPPPPNEGDTCTVADKVFTKSCGKCGKAEAICLADTAGKLTVSPYGACLGETGVCEPGQTEQASCGNCGTLTKTCNQYCAWTSSTCAGQPTSSCAPGTTEYTTAGCAANLYRSRSCATACTWGGFSTVCAEPNNPIKLTLPSTVNGVASPTYTLAATKQGKKHPSYSCGASASISTTADYPYELIELVNPTASQLTIKLKATSTFDTAYAVYPTNLPPSTDNELKACSKADYSPYDITGVVIPPNAKYLLRISSYYASSNTFSEATTGSVPMTITTTAVQ